MQRSAVFTRRRLLQASFGTLLALPRWSTAETDWRATDHPLNEPRTCLGWWLVTPLASNSVWQDLTRWQQRAQTVNVTAGSGVHQGTERLGGMGEAVYDGVATGTVLPVSLHLVPPFSVSLWFQAPSATLQALVTQMSGYFGTLGWYLSLHPSRGLEIWLIGNTVNDYVGMFGPGPVNVFDGKWHHAVALVAGFSQSLLFLWVDGVSYAIGGDTLGLVTTVANNQPVRFGAFGDGLNPLNGRLDDVRLYRRSLTVLEGQQLAAAPRQEYAGLLATGPRVARVPSVPLRTRAPGLLLQ